MTDKTMMLNLGGFVFSLEDDTQYASLRRKLVTGYKSVQRLANFPTHQLMSLQAERITIRGTWYLPDVNKHISELRKAVYTGRPLLLSDSSGSDLGSYVLLSYDEQQSSLLSDGNAQEVSFTIELHRAYQ